MGRGYTEGIWHGKKGRTEVQGRVIHGWTVPTQSTVSYRPLLTHSCAGPLMWPQVPPMGTAGTEIYLFSHGPV